MSKHKDGVIYTPVDVVEKMLDMAGYVPSRMPGFLALDFMDNSCGTGNILVVALERAIDGIDTFFKALGFSDEQKYEYMKYWLTKHFHGIELDPVACAKCVENLNAVMSNYFGGEVDWEWDIRCGDALTMEDERKYHFVVCNPPYIRTHDLECDLTGYEFVEDGMKDMYLAFYELGLKELDPDGTMCYITPSSWFTSKAGEKMRKHLYVRHMITEVYDYGHTQVFENATTYVEITVIKSNGLLNNYVKYGTPELGEKKWMIPYDSIELDGKFYFADYMERRILEEVNAHHKGNIKVKNGYATLADDVFVIGDTPWNLGEYSVPVVKSSTGNWTWCIYPYDKEGKLVSEDVFSKGCPLEYVWLCENRKKLDTRATTEPWYAFGRTQAIKDTWKDKWAIKSIVKTVDDLNPVKAPAGTGVYGGLYILCEDEHQLDCLKTEGFLNYVKSLRKYKSGGYYTFSSKDLENYLNWYNYDKDA